VIAWSLHGEGRADHDLLLVLNARPGPLDVEVAPDAAVPGGGAWRLHPILARSADPVVRGASCEPRGPGAAGGSLGATALRLHVPARTVAVFLRSHGQTRPGSAPGPRHR